MKPTIKPTIKQKLTFSILLRKIEKKEPFDLQEIMMKSGFSEATARNPGKNLLEKDGFRLLLSQIDDQVILARFYQILLDNDKR